VRIQRHRHRLWYSLEIRVCLRGQLREAPNRKDLAIGELAVTYHQRSAKTHLLLISMFLDVLLIRLVRDPMPPTIAQRRVIFNAARLVLQTEVCINC
jgi:hypothetical protein